MINITDYGRLGWNIKSFREIKCMTQKELASICGTSENTIIHAEHGHKIDTYTAYKISHELSVSLDTILLPLVRFDVFDSVCTTREKIDLIRSFSFWLSHYKRDHRFTNRDIAKMLDARQYTIVTYLKENSCMLPSLDALEYFSGRENVTISYMLGDSDKRIGKARYIRVLAMSGRITGESQEEKER